jgi:predicted nucleic acid-binding protein
MRVLLDTNIIIHRESNKAAVETIGVLFNWLDKLHYTKCIHPLSQQEIEKFRDKEIVRAITIKSGTYNTLKTEAPETEIIGKVREQFDKNENDAIDTSLLKEVYAGRVDILITEDRKMHHKARYLGIGDKVFSIDAFLEKVNIENPALADYKVLPIRKMHIGTLNLEDPFFDTLKEDYPGFERWFNKKADEEAYVCRADSGEILAFLYVKVERPGEDYSSIEPGFAPGKRLKIGTFKVVHNGFRLGERFLKIIFDNALENQVEEIYVTIFNKRLEQQRLIKLFENWGFYHYGNKVGGAEPELVYVRDFSPAVNHESPQLTYPFIDRKRNKFVVPIYPAYHTDLLPDSVLRTESPRDYDKLQAHRNAIKKVYITRSPERNIQTGDILLFYRTKYNGPAHHTSVITTIGVVDNVITDINSAEEFISLCRKRSVFTDEKLKEHWDYNPRNRPFVVKFLYVYSFNKRLNLKALKELNILEEAPRSFEKMPDEAFLRLITETDGEKSFIVN